MKERIIQIHPLREPFVGMKVVRGPNWSFVNQDGGAGTVGEVIDIILDHTICVKWPNAPDNLHPTAVRQACMLYLLYFYFILHGPGE